MRKILAVLMLLGITSSSFMFSQKTYSTGMKFTFNDGNNGFLEPIGNDCGNNDVLITYMPDGTMKVVVNKICNSWSYVRNWMGNGYGTSIVFKNRNIAFRVKSTAAHATGLNITFQCSGGTPDGSFGKVIPSIDYTIPEADKWYDYSYKLEGNADTVFNAIVWNFPDGIYFFDFIAYGDSASVSCDDIKTMTVLSDTKGIIPISNIKSPFPVANISLNAVSKGTTVVKNLTFLNPSANLKILNDKAFLQYETTSNSGLQDSITVNLMDTVWGLTIKKTFAVNLVKSMIEPYANQEIRVNENTCLFNVYGIKNATSREWKYKKGTGAYQSFAPPQSGDTLQCSFVDTGTYVISCFSTVNTSIIQSNEVKIHVVPATSKYTTSMLFTFDGLDDADMNPVGNDCGNNDVVKTVAGGLMQVYVNKVCHSWSFLQKFMGGCAYQSIIFNNRYVAFKVKSTAPHSIVCGVGFQTNGAASCNSSVGKSIPNINYQISQANAWEYKYFHLGGNADTIAKEIDLFFDNGTYYFDWIAFGDAAYPFTPQMFSIPAVILKTDTIIKVKGRFPHDDFNVVAILDNFDVATSVNVLPYPNGKFVNNNEIRLHIIKNKATPFTTSMINLIAWDKGSPDRTSNLFIDLKNYNLVIDGKKDVKDFCTKDHVAKLSDASSIVWTYPAGITASGGGDSLKFSFPSYDVSGYIKASYAGGKDSVYVSFHYLSSTNKIMGDSALCNHDVLTYSVNPSIGATSCLWQLPAGISAIGNANESTIKVILNSVILKDTIKVQAINSYCKSIASKKTITVYSSDFGLATSPSGTQILTTTPMKASFFNNTNNRPDYNFKWDFGDGSIDESNVNPITYNYKKNGTYNVILTAQNKTTGCRDTLVLKDAVACTGGIVCSHSAIITKLTIGNKCIGDSIDLQANAGTGFNYQWYHNGSPIMNASNQNLRCGLAGSYVLEITKDGCVAISDPLLIQFFSATKPFISVLSGDIKPCLGGSMILGATAGFDHYKWSNDSIKSTTTVNKSGNYFVTVTDANGCKKTSDPFIVNASDAEVPNICAVTVNASNKNVILWDRPASGKIKKYIIYKEGSSINKFDSIGAVDYNDYNSFVDENSNAVERSDRYRIAVIDSCDGMSAYSSIHKTMHLTLNLRYGGGINLFWEKYEGLDIPGYTLYRGDSPADMKVFKNIPSSLITYTIIDSLMSYYQVGINLPKTCSASPLKAETGPYTQSLSNIVEFKTISLTNREEGIISVYPNPITDHVIIKRTSILPIRIKLFNSNGELIIDRISSEEILNTQGLPAGMYFLQVGEVHFKIIKQ